MQKIASYKPQAAKHPASAIDSKSSKLLTALMRTHTLMDRCCYREQAPETTNGVNESKHLGGPLLLRICQPAGNSQACSSGGELVGRGGGQRERGRGGRDGPVLECKFSFFLFLSSFLCPFCFLGALFFSGKGGGRDGDPTMTGSVDLRSWDNGYAKSHRRRCGSGGAAAMTRRAACSGIANKRLHTHNQAWR